MASQQGCHGRTVTTPCRNTRLVAEGHEGGKSLKKAYIREEMTQESWRTRKCLVENGKVVAMLEMGFDNEPISDTFLPINTYKFFGEGREGHGMGCRG